MIAILTEDGRNLGIVNTESMEVQRELDTGFTEEWATMLEDEVVLLVAAADRKEGKINVLSDRSARVKVGDLNGVDFEAELARRGWELTPLTGPIGI